MLQGFQAQYSVFNQVITSSQTLFDRWDTHYVKGLKITFSLTETGYAHIFFAYKPKLSSSDPHH